MIQLKSLDEVKFSSNRDFLQKISILLRFLDFFENKRNFR